MESIAYLFEVHHAALDQHFRVLFSHVQAAQFHLHILLKFYRRFVGLLHLWFEIEFAQVEIAFELGHFLMNTLH